MASRVPLVKRRGEEMRQGAQALQNVTRPKAAQAAAILGAKGATETRLRTRVSGEGVLERADT
jgi:hypothetical protein